MAKKQITTETSKKEAQTTSITISKEVAARLNKLKGEKLTQSAILTYLLDNLEFRFPLDGKAKAEKQLREWLTFGFDKKITATELKKAANVNYPNCELIIKAYQNEVDNFNNQISK